MTAASKRLRAASAALAMAALASAATLGAGPREDLKKQAGPLAVERYVAMGSSFAAGSGIAPIKPGTPPRCGRSSENYATLLAEELRMTLVDVTCGGATTAHVLGPWNELPAQVDALTRNTRLVTITIGGNDIGYVGYLIAQSCKVRGPMRYGKIEIPCGEAKVPDEAAYARMEEGLRAIAHEVRRRAPRARLVFVQYFEMVPKKLCGDVPLQSDAAETAQAIGKRLAQITAQVANETGATLLGSDNIAKKRMPCGKAQAWVTGHPENPAPGEAVPWHPTRAGHAVIARELDDLLGARPGLLGSLTR